MCDRRLRYSLHYRDDLAGFTVSFGVSQKQCMRYSMCLYVCTGAPHTMIMLSIKVVI